MLITHIYPNFLFLGRKGTPSFPPVILIQVATANRRAGSPVAGKEVSGFARSAYLDGIGRLTSTPSFKYCNSNGPLLCFLEGNGK
jgi:hypothetical protein